MSTTPLYSNLLHRQAALVCRDIYWSSAATIPGFTPDPNIIRHCRSVPVQPFLSQKSMSQIFCMWSLHTILYITATKDIFSGKAYCFFKNASIKCKKQVPCTGANFFTVSS
jgi:hypothetical protein